MRVCELCLPIIFRLLLQQNTNIHTVVEITFIYSYKVPGYKVTVTYLHKYALTLFSLTLFTHSKVLCGCTAIVFQMLSIHSLKQYYTFTKINNYFSKSDYFLSFKYFVL